MARFAPTGRRTAYAGPNLPRSVQQLGLPPIPGSGGPGAGGLPNLPPIGGGPARPVRAVVPPVQRITTALDVALRSDNPNAALAHALRDPREYQIAAKALQRIQAGQVQRSQAIQQLGQQLRAGQRIDQLTPGADQNYLQLGEKYGLNPEEAQTLHELLATEKGPQGPALLGSILGKAANAVPAAEAGYIKGVLNYYQDQSTHNLAPWSYINSLPEAAGKGFVEVPGAVREGYDFTQLLQEKNNPDSLLYRYALPIGIGMDFLLDPTIYLSGGMTAETKILSATAIFNKHARAVAEAEKLIKAGKAVNHETGALYTMHDLDTVVGQVKVTQGDPWSLGDEIRLRNAAKYVREQQLELRRQARRGQLGRKRQIGAILAPGRVAGGAGVRFAGMEIPGTARLGAWGAQRARALQAARFERAGGQEGGSLAAKMVPDSAMRHTVSDLDRSVAIGHRLEMQKVINAGPLTHESNIENLLTAKMYQTVKEQRIIPGRPSTTGPETGAFFNHSGELRYQGGPSREGQERAANYPEENINNIYDEHNNLLGSLTWEENAFDPDVLFLNTAYIRRDFRNARNWQKLIEPIVQSGKKVDVVVQNHQLGRVINRMIERGDLPQGSRVRFVESSTLKRGRTQVPWETDELPLLATPDMIEEIATKKVMGTVDQIAPSSVRENVHHMGVSKMSKEQKEFRDIYDNRVNLFRGKALEAGWDRSKVEELIRYYADEYPDPVDALARMQTHLDINVASKEWIKSTLENPVFARKLEKTRVVPETGTVIYRADPPAGFSYFKHNNKEYAVKTPVAHALEVMKNDAFLQYMHNQGPYAFTNIQDWWKIMATMPNPSFHTMNFLGAVWNNQLAGMYNPANYLGTYWNYLHKSRLERSARLDRPTLRAPIRALRGKAPKSTPETKRALRAVKELEVRGGGGRSSFIFAETEAELGDPSLALLGPKSIVDRLTKPSPELRARYAKTPPQLAQTEMRVPKARMRLRSAQQALIARRARQALSIGLAPFTGGTSLVGMIPEVSRFGRTHVGGPIENLVRMTPFVTKAHDPYLLHTLRQLDDSFGPPRAMGYDFENFTLKQREQAYDISAALVRRYQFDYSDLTDFERRFVKSVFPFYTYYRKNFVVQAQEVIKRPRNFLAAKALANYLDEQAGDLGPDLEAILPQYFENLMAFQIPVPNSVRDTLGLPKDQPIFLNPKLPMASLNLFPPLWGVVNQEGKLTPQSMGSVLAPVLGSVGPHALGIPGSKMWVEYITGWEFGLNRPIDFQRASSNDWRNSYQDAPFYAKYLPHPIQKWMGITKDKRGRLMMPASNRYILDQSATPFITNWGSSVAPGAASDVENAKARANTISWLTGVRMIPADMHRLSKNQAYAIKNMLEARQSELRSRDLDLTDQDEESLDIARDLVDIAKEVDDERYLELYGEERGGG